MRPVGEEIFDEIDQNKLWDDLGHRRESFKSVVRFVEVGQKREDDKLILYKVNDTLFEHFIPILSLPRPRSSLVNHVLLVVAAQSKVAR